MYRRTIGAMRHINKLLFFYLAALVVILLSVATNLFVTFQIGESLAIDASRINVSGRQRMLSQRIIYLAQDLTDDPTLDGQASLSETIAQFEAGIDLFARSHDALSTNPTLEPALERLYFSTENGPSLDERVRDYIRLARQVAQDPSDIGSLVALKTIERAGLLRDLDRVVGELESMSVAHVTRLRQIAYISLAIAIGIVLLEVVFVFLPGHRIVRQTLDDLRAQNKELQKTRETIDAQNAALQKQTDALLSEREKLQSALEQSEALRREQVEFTYAVSHDLKSPTNTIRMVLDEVTEDPESHLSEEMQDMVTHAQATIDRMGVQIEDILAYARSAQNSETPGPVDLQACLDRALADLRGEITASQARIEVGALPTIWGYARQIHALFLNLISNGMKYQAAGHQPVIEVICEPGEEHGSTRLTIRDNGIGIAPEHHKRIFGMFQRLHRNEDCPGSGLGLATCLRIAQNHDGRIDLTSAPGEGATFEVILRLDSELEEEKEQKGLAA